MTVTIIEPRRGWVGVNMRELIEFHELLWVMVTRDLKSRYKQTLLGASWAILSPLMSMVVFTLVFGQIAKLSPAGVPQTLFFMSATVPWALFTSTLSGASNSLVGNAGLIKKIYFPRLYIPMVSAVTSLVDFTLAFVVLLGMCLSMGYVPTVNIVYLPLFILLSILTAMGAGLWLAALMVLFRDVRNVIAFGIQAWMYATPVVYPREKVPSELVRSLLDLNPMAPVIEGFRWCLLGQDTAPTPMIGLSCAVALLLFVTGLMFFRRLEKTFADMT